MKVVIKSRKELGLSDGTVSRNGRIFSSTRRADNPGRSINKGKAKKLQEIMLECLTNEMSPMNIEKVLITVMKEKPEKILDVAKALLPKEVAVEIEEKKYAPIIIPALEVGLEN